MQFLHNYSIEAQLKSLSERLKHFCKHTESNHSFASNLKSENLKYNISLVAAHIILNLKFIDRSKNVFLNIIQEYNNKHKTSLAYEDFKKINWIRDVNDEILMPGGIKSFISQIGYYATEGKPIDIPADKVDISKCLQDYYNKCFDNAALTISNEKVEEILSKYAAPGLSAKYLQDSDILFYNTKTGLYNWKGSDCTRYLNNEIAATLWLLSCGENATRENFQQWFRLLIGAGIWVHDLSGYLSYDNTCKISEYAFDKLYIEPDLLKCDNEFAKTWLDGESYRHIDINTDIPVVKFDYSNTYNQVENIQYHKWRFHDAFDYQRIRSFCYLLVRLIINHDKEASYPYKEIIKLLKDTSRPFLTWTLFKEIPKDFAQVIPYLLTEPELIPLAFKQIDKTEIQTEFISKQTQQEQQFEDACNLKNEWWLEMFDFLLEQLNHSSKSTDEAGELIAKILFTTANDVFYLRNGHRNQLILHNAYRKRYDEALKKLANKKITNYNVYPTPPVNPNITLYLLPGMVDYLSNWYKKQPLQHTESISLTSGFLDVCIETLQLFHTKNENPSLNTELEDKLKTSESELIKTLTEYLQTYYSSTQIEVTTYYETGTEVRKVRRSSVEFGFEIINWGLLYLKLYNTDSLEKVENVFTKQLIIDINTHKYDDSNREQVEKIKVWLKSLLLAFINVHQKKQDFISKGLPAEKFLKDIENTIASLSIKFSSYKLSEGSINIFEETYNSFGYNQYHEHITTLLFRAVNYFKHTDTEIFLTRIFENSIDTGMMLLANNILDNQKLKEIVSAQIEKINIETFIKSSSTVTDLQYALIDAVNSDKHWHLAKPLIEKIQKHYEKRTMNDDNIENFLFEINLLLAFKEKDITKLTAQKLPAIKEYYPARKDHWAEYMKRFFIALHKLYNDKKYAEAITQLEPLHSAEEKNVRYAFHLYQARLLNAIKENNADADLIIKAWQKWQQFAEKPGIDGSKELFELTEQLNGNNLLYFSTIKDAENFDRVINKLSKKTLFEDEIIPFVYNYYTQRGLHEMAYEYISNATAYLNENGTIPSEIKTLHENAESPALLSKLKISLTQIASLNPKNITRVTPENINDKKELSQFILNELLLGLRVMKDKIHGIEQVTHEDRFTDLLLASLRLRFPIWGWAIIDQARTGHSPTKINAGETDLLIQAAGKNIALIEALVLTGGDFTKTSKHILKCFEYVSYLNSYYIITYYKGEAVNFDNCWNTYQGDVLKITYPSEISIDSSFGFEDLSIQFDNARNIKLAKTLHNSDVQIFHVMIKVV